jgi:anti-sigma B factor antagonist
MGLDDALDPPFAPPFGLRTATRGTRTTVTVAGEVDLATAGRLEREMAQAIAAGSRTLALDLSQVGFMSSSGLHVLISADNTLRAQGGRLFIVSAPAVVQRLLCLTGLDRRFSFAEPPLLFGAA